MKNVKATDPMRVRSARHEVGRAMRPHVRRAAPPTGVIPSSGTVNVLAIVNGRPAPTFFHYFDGGKERTCVGASNADPAFDPQHIFLEPDYTRYRVWGESVNVSIRHSTVMVLGSGWRELDLSARFDVTGIYEVMPGGWLSIGGSVHVVQYRSPAEPHAVWWSVAEGQEEKIDLLAPTDGLRTIPYFEHEVALSTTDLEEEDRFVIDQHITFQGRACVVQTASNHVYMPNPMYRGRRWVSIPAGLAIQDDLVKVPVPGDGHVKPRGRTRQRQRAT